MSAYWMSFGEYTARRDAVIYMRKECEKIRDRVRHKRAEIQDHKLCVDALAGAVDEAELTLQTLQRFHEELEADAQQLSQEANSVENNAYAHMMESTLDMGDIDHMLLEDLRADWNKAMTEVVDALRVIEQARQDMDKIMMSLREKLDEMSNANGKDGIDGAALDSRQHDLTCIAELADEERLN